MVRAGSGHDGFRPVSFPDSFHFAGNDVQGFIPANPPVSRFTSVFRVPFAFGVEVLPDEGVFDTDVRVNPCFLAHGEGGDTGLPERRKLPVAGINCPRGSVAFIENEGADPYYFPVPHMDENRAADGAVGKNFLQDKACPFQLWYSLSY
jgi:hypothetical protein